MRMLWRAQRRQFIHRPLGTLAVAAMLAIITAVFVFVQATAARLEAPLEDYFKTYHAEDFHVTLGPIDAHALTASQFNTLCHALGDIDACFGIDQSDKEAMNRLSLKFQALAQRDPSVYDTIYEPYLLPLIEQYDFLIERAMVTTVQDGERFFRFISVNNTVNIPHIIEGKAPENIGEIALLKPFAVANDLSIDDSFRIGNQTWRITGYFMAPNYILPVLERHYHIMDPTHQSLVLATETSIRNIPSTHTVIYQIIGDLQKLGDDFSVTETLTADLHHFGRSLHMIRSAIPRDYNVQMITPSFESTSALVFSNVYLITFTIMASGVMILVFNQSLNHQTNTINIMQSLGHTKKTIAQALAFPGIIIGLFSAFGFIVGALLSAHIFDLYTARYYMPESAFMIPPLTLFLGLLMVLLPYGLYYLLALKHLKHTKEPPKTPYGRAFKHAFVFTLIGWMMILAVSSQSLVEDFTETTLEGIHYENLVVLNGFTDTIPDHAEPFSAVQLQLTTINDSPLPSLNRIQGYGLPIDTTMKRLDHDAIESNKNLLNGVYVTRPLAEANGITQGDTITLSLGNVRQSFFVVGIHNDLIEHAVYMEHSMLNAMSGFEATMYNAYYTNNPITDQKDVSLTINPLAVAQSFQNLFRLSSIILYTLMGFAIVMALAMFIGIIANTMTEEQQTTALLKALGYYDYEIFKVFFKTTTLALIIAFLLGGLLAMISLTLILTYVSNYFGFVFIGRVDLSTMLGSFLLANVVAWLTMMVLVKKSAHTALHITLKKR